MITLRNKRRLLFLVGAFIILAALACNAPGRAPSPTATSTAPPILPSPTAPQSAEDVSPTPALTPSATNTPAPDVSGPGGCTLNAAYVADITVADNAEFEPGESFTKVWRIRNSGTCTWEEGSQLVFVSGEQMGDSTAVEVPKVAADSTTDVSVDMKAPSTPGTYRSTWQMQDPEGVRFGAQVYVQIVVPEEEEKPTETPTEEATQEPTEEVTEEPTEESSLSDLVITDLEIDTNDPRQGIPLHIVATIRNQGGSAAENFRWAWRVCVHEDCEYTEAPETLSLEPDEEVTVQMEYLFEGWTNYTTEAWVDSRENIEESNEDNNTRQLTIPVKQGMPDLVITSISFDPDPPVKDQDVTIEVVVRNRGSKPANAFDVEWWASTNAPSPACQWTVSGGLPDTKSKKLTCTYAYPSWYAKITTRAIADVQEDVVELNETNNTRDKETSVSKP